MKIQPGDLVVPVDDYEFLFSSPDKVADEADPINLIWNNDMPGIVLEVRDFHPPRSYYHARVIVDDMIGWTYSDYIKRISSILKK
jgi:hypothetical protein